MDAQEALGIAAGSRQAAARSRIPGWYPPLNAALFATGSVTLGIALLHSVHPGARWALLAVAAVAWLLVVGLSVAFSRRGGVVPRLENRGNSQRWLDVAPSLLAVVLDLVVWAAAGLAWMLVFSGVALGAAEWFRLARRAR